jgi:thiosulfate dehydrogenase (quinone) large subunit
MKNIKYTNWQSFSLVSLRVLIGFSLIIGFWSRWACIGGILLLLVYDFCNLPLIVNKNLNEVFDLLVLFLFPSEKIAGIERMFSIQNTEDL